MKSIKGIIEEYSKKNKSGYIKALNVEENPNKKRIFFRSSAVKNDSVSLNVGQIVEALDIKRMPKPHKKCYQEAQMVKVSLLPKQTAKVLSFDEIDNYHLALNKATYPVSEETDHEREFRTHNLKHSGKLYEHIIERQRKAVYDSGSEHRIMNFKQDWRMVVGLGQDSIHETSMTLHHTYGVPYIPGQALKGVTRSAVIQSLFAFEGERLDLSRAEERALQDPLFCDLFGCPETSHYKEARKGRIVFHDAFPVRLPNVEPDVMNSHYQKYYGEGKPPADYLDPNPVFFLTLKESCFQIILSVREGENKKLGKDIDFKLNSHVDENSSLLDLAKGGLKIGLEHFGIGSKTAVGYGTGEVKK